jgi:hypothetical protein
MGHYCTLINCSDRTATYESNNYLCGSGNCYYDSDGICKENMNGDESETATCSNSDHYEYDLNIKSWNDFHLTNIINSFNRFYIFYFFHFFSLY